MPCQPGHPLHQQDTHLHGSLRCADCAWQAAAAQAAVSKAAPLLVAAVASALTARLPHYAVRRARCRAHWHSRTKRWR